MLKNRIKTAFRNLVKHKRFSLLNILGLAIGLACFLLIMLWVQDELSYDSFHTHADETYVVFRNDNGRIGGVTTRLLAPALKTDLPEVVEAAAYVPLPESFKPYIEYDGVGFEENIALTEPAFFHIFSFDFVKGDPGSALEDPNSVIITERMRQKYFGHQSAIGKSLTLTLGGREALLQITGVLENLPHNTHIRRDFFLPIDFIKAYGVNWDTWSNYPAHTYIQTQGAIDQSSLEAKATEVKQGNFTEENFSYTIMPLEKIHLHATNIEFFVTTGNIRYVYIFSAIAAIILLIACMNYMNLSTALSLRRSREIGIKKVLGAGRSDLIRQYFGETFLLTTISLLGAIALASLLLPTLNRLAGKSLTLNFFDGQFLVMIFSTILVTSIIAGSYPALFLSGFQPMQALRERLFRGSQRHGMRQGLIVFQFALSIGIIVATITVMNQMHFIRNTDLGYEKENVVALSLKDDIMEQYDAFKNRLQSNPDIQGVTLSEPVNAAALGKTEGVSWPGKEGKFSVWLLHADYDFAQTFKVDMEDGRFYSEEYSSDATNAFVINESAANEMGLKSPVGTPLTVWGREGSIIGVTENFHFASLHNTVEPLIFRIPDPDEAPMFYRQISVRLSPNSLRESLTFIRGTWNSFFPGRPFDYQFVDDQLNASYTAEIRMGTLFRYFSFLAVFIACLGLYGLTAFTIEQKQKDIGVRKVLGASVPDIAVLFSRSYVWLILIASIIAWPVAWYAMRRWLQNFAYHIDLTIWPFLLAGTTALVIALLTVSWQAVRAATANPVESLRYE